MIQTVMFQLLKQSGGGSVCTHIYTPRPEARRGQPELTPSRKLGPKDMCGDQDPDWAIPLLLWRAGTLS
jgi:hypothetical protein